MSAASEVTAECTTASCGGSGMSATAPQLVQRVVRLAVDVFRSRGTASKQTFQERLTALRQLTHQLTAQDVAFDPAWVRDRRPYNPTMGVAPMTYVHLLENDAVSIGIFILKNGFTLPMHDHPHMHGVLKVLHGSLLMQSYTRVPCKPADSDQLHNGGGGGGGSDGGDTGDGPWDVRQTRIGPIYRTKKETLRRLSPADTPCLVTPEQSNIHHIRAVDGPVAFLDILAPPYDDEQHTYHNFRELEPERLRQLSGGALTGEGWLIRVRNNHFHSDSAPYVGPSLDDIR